MKDMMTNVRRLKLLLEQYPEDAIVVLSEPKSRPRRYFENSQLKIEIENDEAVKYLYLY